MEWLDTLNVVDFFAGLVIGLVGIALSVWLFVVQQRDKFAQIAHDLSETRVQMRAIAETTSEHLYAYQAKVFEVTNLLADRATAAGKPDTAELIRSLVPEIAKLVAASNGSAEPAVPGTRAEPIQPSMEQLIDVAVRLPLPLRKALTAAQPGGPFDPARRTIYGADGKVHLIDPAQIVPLVEAGFLRRSAPAGLPQFANDIIVPPASAAALRLADQLFPG